MKRFAFIFALTAVITGVLTYFMPRNFAAYMRRVCPAESVVTVYCRQTDLPAEDLGTGYAVLAQLSDYFAVLNKCRNVDGVSVCFDGDGECAERLCKFFQIRNATRCQLDGITVICGYSAKISGGVVMDGARVNVQIAYGNGKVCVGSPLILGGY